MNAWAMVQRCSLAQWRGYSQDVRNIMESYWDAESGPGRASELLAGVSRQTFVLWRVENVRRDKLHDGNFLISVKVDVPYESGLIETLVYKWM